MNSGQIPLLFYEGNVHGKIHLSRLVQGVPVGSECTMVLDFEENQLKLCQNSSTTIMSGSWLEGSAGGGLSYFMEASFEALNMEPCLHDISIFGDVSI